MLDSLRNTIISFAEQGIIPFPFQYGFVINALICGILIGPVLGTIGIMVVSKKMAFFSEAIGHAAMTGIAIGILVGEPYHSPYISLFGYCILFGIIINYTKNRTEISADTLIGVFLAVSIALGGMLLIYVSSKVNTHILENILFGSILTVNDKDIYLLIVVNIVVLAIIIPYFNRMLLTSFNINLAAAKGVNVKLLEYMFIVIVTIITIASVKIIGSILVEALLLIPAASAKNISKSLREFLGYSIIFSLISCILGIYLPIYFKISIPSGGAIITVAAGIFLMTIIYRLCFKR